MEQSILAQQVCASPQPAPPDLCPLLTPLQLL